MTSRIPELSIILPCYNESGNIATVLRRFTPLAKRLALELILVDNGSTDNSSAVLATELQNPLYEFAKTVRVPVNIGYGYGISFGLSESRAPVVGYSHADLQTPPEDIERAYRLYVEMVTQQAPCLVKGRRPKRATKDEAFVSAVYNALGTFILGLPRLDLNAQPKIFDRKLLPRIIRGPSDFSFDLHVLDVARREGCHFREFDVNFELRTFGQSKWAHHRLTKIRTIMTCFYRMVEMRIGRYA